MSSAHLLPVVLALGLGCGAPGRAAEPAPSPGEPTPAPLAAHDEPPSVPTTLCAGELTETGSIDDRRLTEISGLVASRRDPALLYAHNDSGEPVARFFALATDGSVRAEVEVDGAPHVDWEDVALGTTPDGRERLYFADIGDNGARDGSLPPRPSVDVVVVEPPAIPAAVPASPLHVGFERLTFTYPDGPHDSEAIVVSAAGDLYLFSKTASGPHALYRAAAPQTPGTSRVLERVMELLPASDLGDSITGADLDASGRLAIRTYRGAYVWTPAPSGRVEDTLAGLPLALTHFREPQGEAIALVPDGLYTVSEGEDVVLHFLPFAPCVTP